MLFLISNFKIYNGCNDNWFYYSSSKVGKPENPVARANQDLNSENGEYIADAGNYRKEMTKKIAANEISITEYKARIEKRKNWPKSVAKGDSRT